MKPLLTLRVPATTANLGAGFDCLGLALDLWNTFELHRAPEGAPSVTIEASGEGAETLPRNHTNIVARIIVEELFNTFGRTLPFPLRIVAKNAVPCGSGMGSSSTAVIAGLYFAHALAAPDMKMETLEGLRKTVLERAVRVEGHGDNVAPALLGGLVAVVADTNKVLARNLPYTARPVVVCVPEFAFLTSKARSVLPPGLTRADAIFNIGHALLTAEALRTGDLELLSRALDDRIHEPYRFPVIPGAIEARDAAKEAGAIGVALSGAGPGVIAFGQKEKLDGVGRAMVAAFAGAGLKARHWVLNPVMHGAELSV